MRCTWAKLLYEEMQKDDKIVLITPDMGYGVLDQIRDDFPERFYNVGIAETLATNMAVGLALSGKKPWVYGIITFTLYKALEQIRNYVIGQNICVKYALCGKDKTYAQLDISHWALEDKKIAEAIGLTCHEPDSKETLELLWPDYLSSNKPFYLRLP
jgi:transketolase